MVVLFNRFAHSAGSVMILTRFVFVWFSLMSCVVRCYIVRSCVRCLSASSLASLASSLGSRLVGLEAWWSRKGQADTSVYRLCV